MRVIVEDAVFATPRNSLALAQLLHFAAVGRHIILTQPDYQRGADSAANRWLARQSQELREEYVYGLETSLQNEAKAFDRDVELVISDEPDLASQDEAMITRFRMSLVAANALLAQPLRVLVENARNDRAFILMMMPESWRNELKQSESDRWIEFISGGGLGELKKTIEGITDPAERSRRVAIFDSDAREPRAPSKFSHGVRARCRELDVACHQLARRAAENYLPLPALDVWAGFLPVSAAAPKRCLRGFRQLSAEQRHHFNMREGLKADAKSGESSLYRDLSDDIRTDVHEGFGKTVRDLFAHERVAIADSWLDDDGLGEERSALVQTIFSRL